MLCAEGDTVAVGRFFGDREVVLECCFVFGEGGEEGELWVYWLVAWGEEAGTLVRWGFEVCKSHGQELGGFR